MNEVVKEWVEKAKGKEVAEALATLRSASGLFYPTPRPGELARSEAVEQETIESAGPCLRPAPRA